MLFISCKNNDVEIKILDETCGIGDKYSDSYTAYQNTIPSVYSEANDKELGFTHSVVLKNKSQTKVYKVLVQVNTNQKITYQEYNIQPTEVIELGCDRDFAVQRMYDSNSQSEFPYVTEMSTYKLIYKIHKVDLVSEY